MNKLSLQEHYAPHNACFGCGQSNTKGLRVKSFVDNDMVVAEWFGKTEHEAFPGMLSGGIIGTLLDCHSNWSAAYYLMLNKGLETPPCTVTAYYNVKLLRPTPSDSPVKLVAKLVEVKEERAKISAQLFSNDLLCAECEGLFVAVKPGHPAYHRW